MPLEYVTLGRSGLKVSRTCLGTVNVGTGWGLGVEEAESRAIIDAFLDAGHNLIDTASNYSNGEAEEIVGRAVRSRRDTVVIATKGYMPDGPGPNDVGSSRAHLTRALEGSLRRLGTDYVDLYQCHMWDAATPIEETMATLDGFVRSGKIRYVGCSNFTASQIVEAQWAADRIRATPLTSLQSQYSLIARDIEAEILPTGAHHGLGTLVWGTLGGGILAGRYRRGAAPDADTRMGRLLASPEPQARRWATAQLSDRNLDIADAVVQVAAELGTTPAAVALAWVRDRPGITSVIVGPRSLDQLHHSLTGLELTLPGEAIERLDDASGPAPLAVTGHTAA
jgi:aryl-alcohol dehydrogenase-like predicted oxidoreductase